MRRLLQGHRQTALEINRNMRAECWHPESYIINEARSCFPFIGVFPWNAKVSTRKPSSGTALNPADGNQQQSPLPVYMEEGERETPVCLKEKELRISMEQQVYRIWTYVYSLSAFTYVNFLSPVPVHLLIHFTQLLPHHPPRKQKKNKY